MLYVNRTRHIVADATDHTTIETWHAAGDTIVSRAHWCTLTAAEQVAADLNIVAGSTLYLAIDNGAHVYPRFDVIRIPRVGDKVSYTYNGDTYPDGEVVRVGPTFHRITTSTGRVYHRGRKGGYWLHRGMWRLIPGHVSTTNWER